MNSILEIQHLSKHYFINKEIIEVLKDINFKVKDDEIIAIVGASGCGKSSLLSIISNLLDYTDGKIIYRKPLTFGYMFQSDTLFPWLTVRDNCLLGLKIIKKDYPSKEKELDSLLKKYHLDAFKDKYPHNLSGGMRQRVQLIRTILINPDILLLDEPFSALDYQTHLYIADDVYKLVKSNKKAMIIVTHDIEEAVSIADKVIVLSNRPSSIIKEIAINKHNLNPLQFRKTEKFLEYTNEIWELMNNG